VREWNQWETVCANSAGGQKDRETEWQHHSCSGGQKPVFTINYSEKGGARSGLITSVRSNGYREATMLFQYFSFAD
jgi:hypothetical protein